MLGSDSSYPLLDALAASVADFLVCLGTQKEAKAARDLTADVRILAANALYTELLDFCAIGMAGYATADARQYAAYVVTDRPPRCRTKRSSQ